MQSQLWELQKDKLEHLSNQWSFGTKSQDAEQMFDEPSRQSGGSPRAAAAGKFAQSWTAEKHTVALDYLTMMYHIVQ